MTEAAKNNDTERSYNQRRDTEYNKSTGLGTLMSNIQHCVATP